MSAILFDLGGTHLRCGIWDDSAGVHLLQKIRLDRQFRGRKGTAIWNDLISMVEGFVTSVRGDVADTAPIVLSFPGPVAQGCSILDAPTLIGEASEFPQLHQVLEKRTCREVRILNDLSAAAWHASRSTTAARFIVVTISSGIGSKIFDRHHVGSVLDDIPYAGEIGHVVVDDGPQAMRCDCGGAGHLGAVSSGRGIERYAQYVARQNPAPFLQSACVVQYGAATNYLTNEEHLVPAAKAGDPWALGVIRDCTRPLGKVLLSIVMAAGLERIVIIGGFALSLGTTYQEILREAIVKASAYRVMAPYLGGLIELGNEEACFLGTAEYAQHLIGV
jgi:glucokinase